MALKFLPKILLLCLANLPELLLYWIDHSKHLWKISSRWYGWEI